MKGNTLKQIPESESRAWEHELEVCGLGGGGERVLLLRTQEELCAPDLLSLAVRPGNMQGLLLATFLLAALSQVSPLSCLLPSGDCSSFYFFHLKIWKEEDGGGREGEFLVELPLEK